MSQKEEKIKSKERFEEKNGHQKNHQKEIKVLSNSIHIAVF